MKKCSFCGKKINNSEKVCPYCFETQHNNNIMIIGLLSFTIIMLIISIILIVI